MDISAYKSNLSLANFLGNGGSALGSGGAMQDVMGSLSRRYQQSNEVLANAGAGDVVQLSEDAEILLAATGRESEDNQLTGIKKGAQNFVVSFFDESGVDLGNISDEAILLIAGLQDVIAASGATGRDMATDRMEMEYSEGNRKAYTLTGEGSRMRIAIEYAEDNKTPVKLSLSDVIGGSVETAEITLAKDHKGVMQMNVVRTQQGYQNGVKIVHNDLEPLSVAFYKTGG